MSLALLAHALKSQFHIKSTTTSACLNFEFDKRFASSMLFGAPCGSCNFRDCERTDL